MRCVYCDEIKNKTNLTNIFLKQDLLCIECRKKMPIKRKIISYSNIKVESFYDYDSLFKSLLIQYKEAYDEALKDVFTYWLDDYLNYRYFDYKIVFVPSSESKLIQRGFNHLELIFSNLKHKRIDGLYQKQELIQEGKDFQERSKMKSNYIYTGEKERKVLVLDDVVTTGSSMMGVYNALKEKVRYIKLLSLAYKNFTKKK